MDATTRYLETFDALRRRKRWATDVTVLRFAAMTLAATTLDDPGARLEAAADELKANARWTDPLRSAIRHAAAAMILRAGRKPAEVAAAVTALREEFRQARIPRGGMSGSMAALLLALGGLKAGTPAARNTLARMKAILERWTADHWWLTGEDDLPMAALHATRDAAVETISVDVERVYQHLRGLGYSRGNALQLVSHVLAIDPRGADAAVDRFLAVATALRECGVTVTSARYDETALLALTSPPASEIVAQVMAWRDELREHRPKPSREIAFSLACGLALAAEAEKAAVLRSARDAAALAAIKAVLDAQQAAMIACMVATTAATSSAASSG